MQPGDHIPEVQDIIKLYHDSECFYIGIVSEVDTAEYSSGYEPERYRVEAQSFEAVLKNRLVNDAWDSDSADIRTSDIVADIFASYIEPEGITLGKITQTSRMWQTYKAQYMTVYAVLQELADEIGYTFQIDCDRKFYFIQKNDFVEVTPPEHTTKLKGKYTKDDMRSVQIITGGSEDTSRQTESTYWTTGQSTVTLGYALSSLVGITINGSTASTGIRGVEDADTGVTFLYQVDSNVITLNSNATTQPTTGDLVVFVYYGTYGITVVRNNASLEADIASRNGTSGQIENLYNDETLATFGDAEKLAQGLLTQYGEAQANITCVCHDFDASQILNIWPLEQGQKITGRFVVVERTISSFGPDKFKINVKLKNRNFYARYGLVITSTEKKKRENVTIYKTPLVSELLTIYDHVTAEGEYIISGETASAADAMAIFEAFGDYGETISTTDAVDAQGEKELEETMQMADGYYTGVVTGNETYYATGGDYTDPCLFDGFYAS
jgi:hypothetical protein